MIATGAVDPIATLEDVDPLPVPDRSRWVGSRRIIFIVVPLVLAVAGSLVFDRLTGPVFHDDDSGPVRTDSNTITSLPVEVGQVFTFGGIILKNYTNDPATLESIRFEPPLGSAVTLVDLKVAGDDRNVGLVGSAVEYPPTRIPTEALLPFKGAVVPRRSEDPKGRGLELFMGLRVNVQGEFGFRHTVLDYRIGGRLHSVRLNDGFITCAPVDAFPPGCHLATFFNEKE